MYLVYFQAYFNVRDRLARDYLSICEVMLFCLNSFTSATCEVLLGLPTFPIGFIFNKNDSQLSN